MERSVRLDLWRAVYKAAWVARKGLRLLPFPHLNGAMVAVWCNGRVLMVQNTYNRYWSFPGGRIDAGESYAEAGARELREETGVVVAADDLRFARGEYLGHALRKDRVEVFDITLTAQPDVEIDPVEIAEARWLSMDEARGLHLFGPSARYLADIRASEIHPGSP